MNCAQQKNGMRPHVRPGARSWMKVVMKLTAPSSDEVMLNTIPISHRVPPLNNWWYAGPVSATPASGG